MEEEKAAEYYDELLRKGGNAAKFKQGLGFGTHSTSVANGDAYGLLSNFVKEASPERASALQKEIRIESIRDKLKKREAKFSRESRRPRTCSPDEDGKRSPDKREATERARRKTPYTRESEEGKTEKSNHRRRSSSSDEVPSKKASDERRRQSRSLRRRNGRIISRSPSYDNSKEKRRTGTNARESGKNENAKRGRGSLSLSSDDSQKSSDRGRKRVRRRGRDESISPIYHSRNRFKRRRTSRANSPSSSYEGRERDRSRSHSRGRNSDYKSVRRSERAFSPQKSRRRQRSRSPTSHRSFYDSRTHNRSTGRPSRRHEDSSRRRHEDDNRLVLSVGRQRDGHMDDATRFRGSKGKEKAPELDYSKLVPNFDSMTLAEKVKAKTKLLLSITVVKDAAGGVSDEWERFNFDKNAPLDDDAKLDYFGDGTGASDDTLFLKNTGSSYLSSSNQVKREALATATHESAIFGPPEGLSLKTLEPLARESTAGKKGFDSSQGPSSDSGAIAEIKKSEQKDPATPLANCVVSEQVIAMQQAGSWQERARKMREAREAALAP